MLGVNGDMYQQLCGCALVISPNFAFINVAKWKNKGCLSKY